MRIYKEGTDEPLQAVWLYLTRPEAIDLANALKTGLRGGPGADSDWHAHIESQDGDHELSIGLYDEGDLGIPPN